jgi:acetyltransferase-like isoleucine patch superfamily enzyme
VRVLVSRAVQKSKSKLFGLALHAPGINLGRGCWIKGSRRIVFGRNFSAGRDLWVEAIIQYRGQQYEPLIEFGDDICLSDNVHITCIERIVIRRNVLIGSKVYISDHNHGRYRGERQSDPAEPPAERRLGGGGPVDIGENVWIGENVVVIGPLNIGEGAILGANSVVTQDVPPRTVVAGVPARVIKRFRPESCSWEKA